MEEEAALERAASDMGQTGNDSRDTLKELRQQTRNNLDLAGKLAVDPDLAAETHMIADVMLAQYAEYQHLNETTKDRLG